MSYWTIFDVKNPAVDFQATFDFSLGLTVGETISSASTAATCYSGSDATPQAIISGAAVPSGKVVGQVITGGLEGNAYLVTCTATTSLGHHLDASAFLVVAAP